ncbi:MAG: hypothetical protein GY710_19680 [Desulfobacteraceae bacterium]|nr:hypothetical protein [Desulfobacteraceae bacterium]
MTADLVLPIDTQPHVLSPIKVDLTFQDLKQKITTSTDHPEIIKIAKKTLDMAQGIWNPKAVYQWFEFQTTGKNSSGNIIQGPNNLVNFDFGCSIKFLTKAEYALISVYTPGQGLEQKSKQASSKGDLLEAYFLDLIGLIILDKISLVITKIAEKQAANIGWGVSPFLSPGSVHGWKTKDQTKLCRLLPLEKIDVKIGTNAVLSPFKTISCLIGLGPRYDDRLVGTTCQVCAKNHDCRIKKDQKT